MNPRYLYMAATLFFSYMLFFQWGSVQQTQAVEREFALAAAEDSYEYSDTLDGVSVIEMNI